MQLGALLTMLTLGSAALVHAQPVKLDPKLSDYEQVSGVSGNLNAIGSDTLNNLMTLWAEEFQTIYPNVKIQIEGKGSSTAPPALIEGTAQVGPMSRQMKGTEIDAFEEAFGYKPTQVRVAIDALAFFVHKDNPIDAITLQQLDGIFSSTRKRGGSAIRNWGDLDVTGTLGNRPISLYGRNSASGTYGVVKQIVLQGGDYRSRVKEQPGSSSVVQGVGSDLAGIGYSGIGYKTSNVKALSIIGRDGEAHAPTGENCLTGDYPLARFLYVYVNKKPGEPLDTLTSEFLKLVLSRRGQKEAIKDGYYPLPAMAAKQEIEKFTQP